MAGYFFKYHISIPIIRIYRLYVHTYVTDEIFSLNMNIIVTKYQFAKL